MGLAAFNGEIFVADTGNIRVQVFGPDFGFRRSFPVAGWEETVGTEPYLTFDSRGSLWLTDSGNSRIQQFSADGRLLAIHGPDIDGENPLKNAKGIAAGQGFLLVSDFGNSRLLRWDPSFLRSLCHSEATPARAPFDLNHQDHEKGRKTRNNGASSMRHFVFRPLSRLS